MSVYFAQPVDGGPVKIGHSADVPARIRQLESHYGAPLAVLATLEGGRDEEQAIHARFAHLRYGQTEQFRPDVDLMEFIGRPLLVSPKADVVERIEPKAKGVSLKVSAEWAAWLDRAVAHGRTDIAKFIDKAVEEYAKSLGFEEKPPRRVP